MLARPQIQDEFVDFTKNSLSIKARGNERLRLSGVKFFSRALPLNDVFSLLRSSRFCSVSALPHFVKFWASGGGKDGFYVETSDDNGEVRTVTPVIVSRGRLRLTLAHCPSVPQIVDGLDVVDDWKGVLDSVILFLRGKCKCVKITVEQRPYDLQFVKGRLNGCNLSYCHDALVDLSNELRAVYYNMDKRHRYTLRKCTGCSDAELSSGDWLKKTDLSIDEGKNEESLQDFRTLLVATRERVYEGFSSVRKFAFTTTYYNSLLTTRLAMFKELYPYGLVKLFTLRDKNERPGASVMLVTSNDLTKVPMAYWDVGGSSEDGRKSGLPTLLQWYVIQRLKEHDYKRYYLGGYNAGNPDDALSLFKRGFGGQIVSGLTAVWLTQPVKAMHNIAYLFTQPLDPLYVADALRAKLWRNQ
jgi:hypothetical protein